MPEEKEHAQEQEQEHKQAKGAEPPRCVVVHTRAAPSQSAKEVARVPEEQEQAHEQEQAKGTEPPRKKKRSRLNRRSNRGALQRSVPAVPVPDAHAQFQMECVILELDPDAPSALHQRRVPLEACVDVREHNMSQENNMDTFMLQYDLDLVL